MMVRFKGMKDETHLSRTCLHFVSIAEYTISHHYRVKMFFKIIDWQFQELNDRFNEVRTNLLKEFAHLNLVNSCLVLTPRTY
ncbi:hypothetical protein H5410_040708 [Solanum commersonii]|uniref:Uncharacterized protein n=1 Tax=Solanum commersonii TaxID=4109 RepID=A0A9J5XQX8_SOLCO|nr:hypothetical protein H5410_040708 [Solanum commersonii]